MEAVVRILTSTLRDSLTIHNVDSNRPKLLFHGLVIPNREVSIPESDSASPGIQLGFEKRAEIGENKMVLYRNLCMRCVVR